jgi:hypothetical protein
MLTAGTKGMMVRRQSAGSAEQERAMSGKHRPPAEDSQQVRDLLRRYACPVPYHEVRTRFLGNIATPKLSASPLNVAKGLWGGAFPEVESIEDLNRLIDTLINGLWNALTIHQKRNEPFRLVKVPLEPSVANLAQLALTRRQELDGFVEGLFDGANEIDLPKKANVSLGVLAEMRAIMGGAHEFATRTVEPAEPAQVHQTFRHLRELTRIMEREINAVVLDCTRARRQMIRDATAKAPTFH